MAVVGRHDVAGAGTAEVGADHEDVAVGVLLDILAGRTAGPVQRVLPCTLMPSDTVRNLA